MTKHILAVVIVLSLLLVPGCSEISERTGTSSRASFEILREAELGSEWKMNQMRIELGAGDEFLILLKLADGDKADGYFYLEEGDDVDFLIEGTSLIYQSIPSNMATTRISSDRFSFVAGQDQGNPYTLTFRNPDDDSQEKSKVVAFLEIIYPATGSMFLPLEAW
jgi:hypothetical protein